MKKKKEKINVSCKKLKVLNKNVKGITLVALVVTIIVLLILASITISFIVGDRGIFGIGKELQFKSKISAIAEEWQLNIGTYAIDRASEKEVYAGEVLKSIIIDEEMDLEESKVQDIKKLITRVGKTEEKYTIIHEGELYYVSSPLVINNEKQTKWCEDIGIKIWEYNPQSGGIKDTNGDYEYVKGIYMCTPKINTGFVKEKTRYINEKDGNLEPGTWINKKPEDNWYDYKNSKWANLYVESEGLESYYVWIPRYAYKVVENERTDVKFVDINNNYTNGENDKTTKWEELQKQGYIVPEAFYYGDNENYLENTPIPGYWMSKYQLSNWSEDTPLSLNYDTSAGMTSITIQNITVNSSKKDEIVKYTYAVNGNILYESTRPEDKTIKNLAKGNKVINVTALDKNGNIIASKTTMYEVADVNEPDLTEFDKDTTFYVYWDEEGKEHNEIPISKEAPEEWYDYTSSHWANIVTRNNGLETYLVWIPRYQYTLNTNNQKSIVRFIKGTGGATEAGWEVPEAFTWGDNNEVQLKGYWMSKYQISEKTADKLTAELTAGSEQIKVKEITGTAVKTGLKYEYYINGNKVHEGTNASENYSFKGLKPSTTYTINIIARDGVTKDYVAAITKKVTTIEINKPDLTGFNEDRTYYVLYDADGNEVIGDKIKNDGSNSPEGWYDYVESKWANIVVTDGEIKNGKIEGAKSTSYFVWIPRYQYKLDTTNQKTDVKFINGTGGATESGYVVPEAFSWGDSNQVQLKGYWMSKYQLSTVK